MKKLLIILIAFLIPVTTFAAYPVAWNATSSNASFIQPNNLNGVIQALKITGTATSTINKLEVGNLNVTTGATMPAAISLSGFTTGSTLFVGTSGTIAQDNANFFWDDTNNRLGIGNAAPLAPLDVTANLTGFTGLTVRRNASQYLTFNERDGSAHQIQAYGDKTFVFTNESSSFGYEFNTQSTNFNSGQAMVITAARNVGIGNTSPIRKLEIATTTAKAVIGNGEMLRIEGDPDGNLIGTVSEIGFGYPAAVGNADVLMGAVKTSVSGFGHSAFYVATRASSANALPIERMRIAAVTGYMGIGTTTPNATLDVARASQDLTNAAAYGAYISALNTTKKLGFGYDTAKDVGFIQSIDFGNTFKNLSLNPNGGNVGIGTTTPSQKLVIESSASNSNQLQFSAPNISVRTYSAGIFDGGASGANFGIYDNFSAANRFTIQGGTGNVGIGSTTPASKLSVQGNALISGDISAANITATGTFNAATFNVTGTGTTTFAGDILARGISAWKYLNVPFIQATSTQASSFLYASTTALTSSGSAYFATAGGNVGIGTTTPDNKLQVVGGIESTGAYVSPTGSKGVVLSSETSFDQLQSFKSRPLYINPLGNDVILESGALGNVGIGSTTPRKTLSVQGNTLVSGSITAASLTATSTITGSNLMYADITVSSSELLNLTSSPKTLIAAPGANKIVEMVDAVIVLKFNTTQYVDVGEGIGITQNSNDMNSLAYTNLQATNFFASSANTISVYPVSYSALLTENSALMLTNNSVDLTLGDSTLQVKITYRIHTIN